MHNFTNYSSSSTGVFYANHYYPPVVSISIFYLFFGFAASFLIYVTVPLSLHGLCDCLRLAVAVLSAAAHARSRFHDAAARTCCWAIYVVAPRRVARSQNRSVFSSLFACVHMCVV